MYSITQFEKPLDKSQYTIDEKTKTFSTNENNLVLDFQDEYGWTFKTGYGCTFKTGYYCTFKTGYGCTFDTGSGCTFKTGKECVAVRRDVFEVIELPEDKTIKLNDCNVKGYIFIPDNSKKQEMLDKAQELINKAEELKRSAEEL